MMADNKYLKKTTRKKRCRRGYYKGALVMNSRPIKNLSDYHYYRQDKNGKWSHIDGWGYATNKDAKGKLIHDPKKANRKYRKGKYYDQFCGYYCVPKQLKKKRFQINKESLRNGV